jgi:alpha-glucosidase
VEALWLTPFYPSPMADGGYDVADYRDVDPRFGTLADFDKLLVEAHARGLRVLIDIVPNHCSDRHAWFQAALAAGPGSPGTFASSTSTAVGTRRRTTGSPSSAARPGPACPTVTGTCTCSPRSSRTSTGNTPPYGRSSPDILRFWLDRGVDGIRIDVAHGMVKAPGLPDGPAAGRVMLVGDETPFFDQDGVHEIYRSWRSILDGYTPERIAVAEGSGCRTWLGWPATCARASCTSRFNFAFLRRAVVRLAVPAASSTSRWPPCRRGRARDVGDVPTTTWSGTPRAWPPASVAPPAGSGRPAVPRRPHADPAVGLRRARAATLVDAGAAGLGLPVPG